MTEQQKKILIRQSVGMLMIIIIKMIVVIGAMTFEDVRRVSLTFTYFSLFTVFLSYSENECGIRIYFFIFFFLTQNAIMNVTC
jgi:hypothetical protein